MSYPQSRSSKLAWLALFAMAGVYFCSYFQRVAVPGMIFTQIQADLGLSASATTAIGAFFLYIYAGAQLFVGVAADRFGGRRTLLAGGALMTVGALIFPLSDSLAMIYFARAITGLGGSCMYLSLIKEADALFGPRQFAAVVGVALFIGYLGGVAGTLPFEWSVQAIGWRNALLWAAGGSALALVLAAAATRMVPHPHKRGAAISLRPIITVCTNRRCWPLMVCGIINFPIYFVLQTTLGKKFVEDAAGMSSTLSATLVMIMMITSAVTTLAMGPLLKLANQRRTTLLYGACAAILSGLCLLIAGVVWHLPSGVFLGGYVMLAMASGVSPVNVALMKEYNSAGVLAQAVGVYNGLTYVGVAILANIAGAVLDIFGGTRGADGSMTYPPGAYLAVLAILGAMAVVSLVAVTRVHETRGQSIGHEPAIAPATADIS